MSKRRRRITWQPGEAPGRNELVELPPFIAEPDLPAAMVAVWANMQPGTLLKAGCNMMSYAHDARRRGLEMLVPAGRGSYGTTIPQDSMLLYMGTVGLDMVAGTRIMRRRFVVVLHGSTKYIVNDLNNLIPT